MRDTTFIKLVLSHASVHGRHRLPWRTTTNPYRILVSEVMLQQTQVPRVAGKYKEFLGSCPSFRALASAPTANVLKVWQGLGYNRRALMLQRCARAVVRQHGGRVPREYEALRALPGVGPYTAGAVLAFAFDMSHPVIETNIRRVYLHHFFPRRRNVPDSDILPLVSRHLSSVISPRTWYAALMDYGAHLGEQSKKSEGSMMNPNRRSRHHVRQPSFEGSFRQLRGRILRHLTGVGSMDHAELATAVGDIRFGRALAALEREGFIRIAESLVHLVA